MDPNTYQMFAIRTAKDYPTREQNFLYFSLGLVGESTEVVGARMEGNDAAFIEKEIGDVMWYTARLSDLVGIKLEDIFETVNTEDIRSYADTDNSVKGLVVSAGAIGEIMKKVVRDDRPIDEVLLRVKFAHIVAYAMDVANDYDLEIEEVMETNIKKLEARYPKLRFDAADAIARADGEKLNE